jgi:hypothetical protein
MEELKALAPVYPEAECLPEEKRKPWLDERWVGLAQADRDAFRAALDAADAAPTEYTVAEQRLAQPLTRSPARVPLRLPLGRTRTREAGYPPPRRRGHSWACCGPSLVDGGRVRTSSRLAKPRSGPRRCT